jgi:hypothetical protein
MRAFGVLLLMAAPAHADYQLNLVGAATAVSASGESIWLTGGGTFNPDGEEVHIGGTFIIHDSNGTALHRGTWRAHQLSRFIPWRGIHELGGVLEVMVTIVTDTGKMDQQRMRFVSTSNKPANVGEDEGVSIGSFLEHDGGMVRFHKR